MNRLFWKILVAFWLTLLAASLAVGYALQMVQRAERAEHAGRRELDRGPRLAMVLDAAEATLRHGGPAALVELLRAEEGRVPEPILLVDADGRDLLGRPVPADALAAAQRAVEGPASTRAVRLLDAGPAGRWLAFAAPEGGRPPPALGGPARPDGPPPRHEPWWPQLLTGLLASLACAAALAWYLTRPVRTLRAAFDAAARGRLDTRVRPLMGRRRDEIADLGADFDRMVQGVQAAFAAQRRLLHDMSHELRSPLARLQVATGLARQNPARLDAALDRIDREAGRLDQLIDQVLTLARLENDAHAEAASPTDLSGLLDAVVADARFEAAGRRITIVLERPGPLPLPLRAELMHRAIENVLRNAIKFSPDGGRIDVRLDAAPAAAVGLEIADRGPGIPADQASTLFEPFHRGHNARGIDGYGLGLAIARQAVRVHGGTIEARPRDGGGLSIRITLPAAAGPAAATPPRTGSRSRAPS